MVWIVSEMAIFVFLVEFEMNKSSKHYI